MKHLVIPILMLCLSACQATFAEPRQIDSHTWDGVGRIVAVGDIHGDYDNYIETLTLAGLVNKRGRWNGGETHFVQVGDIPDRGPDTREIMAHIDKLARQAEKAGGRVHRLMGNHEAMNVYGDLRYVTAEEFEDFAGRNSKDLQDRFFQLTMQDLMANDPEAYAELPENFREEWGANFPLGYVEHQQAWNPVWNPEGEYVLRTRQLNAAVKINGVVFLHGGISDIYADMSLAEITQKAHAELARFDPENPSMITDECGPLWYRGLAGGEPQASAEVVTSILERLSAGKIVVGHTPTPSVVWPRYDGRVVQIDTGISQAYGGYPAFLEITPEGVNAGYPGGKVALPDNDEARLDYLDQVIALDPANSGVKHFRQKILEPAEMPADETEVSDDDPGSEEESPEEEVPVNTCLREDSAAAS
jgi:hypothetical protein